MHGKAAGDHMAMVLWFSKYQQGEAGFRMVSTDFL